jgi:hypothetical protein
MVPFVVTATTTIIVGHGGKTRSSSLLKIMQKTMNLLFTAKRKELSFHPPLPKLMVAHETVDKMTAHH